MKRALGDLEQLLLYVVRYLHGSADGACGPTIRKALEAQTGRLVSPGAIYTTLDRLEQRGLVRSALGDPTPERGGKRKRFYQLRAPGHAALKAAEAARADLARLARLKV